MTTHWHPDPRWRRVACGRPYFGERSFVRLKKSADPATVTCRKCLAAVGRTQALEVA
jgi:hypothetical protein